MGFLKDMANVRAQRNAMVQTASQVKRPTLKDALDLRKNPTKAFQGAPDFDPPTEIPSCTATARIVATAPTNLFLGNDPVHVVSMVVVPEHDPAYAVSAESAVPDAAAGRCTVGATVPVTYQRDNPIVVTLDWG